MAFTQPESLVSSQYLLRKHLKPEEYESAHAQLSSLRIDFEGEFPFISTETASRLEDAATKCTQARRRYLRARTLISALEDACLRGSPAAAAAEGGVGERRGEEGEVEGEARTRERALQAWGLALSRQALRGQPDFLGLSEADLPDISIPWAARGDKASPEEIEAAEGWVGAKAEAALCARAAAVAAAAGGGGGGEDGVLSSPAGGSIAKILDFPKQIKDKQHAVEREKIQLVHSLVDGDELLWKTLEAAAAKLRVLAHVAGLRAARQLPADAARVDHLQAWFDAISAKISVITVQVETETYTASTVPALRNIRSHLDTKMEELKDDIAQIQAKLSEYDCAGPVLTALANDFATLLEKIEEKNSYLNRLKTSSASC